MVVLLDTHVLLWMLGQTGRLSGKARRILDEAEVGFFSAAAIWEIAIKFALGRSDFSVDPREVHAGAQKAGLIELIVTSEAAARVATLPLHHRDPFDRLLVAQAIEAEAVLLTADAALSAYAPHVLMLT